MARSQSGGPGGFALLRGKTGSGTCTRDARTQAAAMALVAF